MSSEDIHYRKLLPRKCDVCRKWFREFYVHAKKKTDGNIILCRRCHLVIMCSPFVSGF